AAAPGNPSDQRYNLYLAYVFHQDCDEPEAAAEYLDRLLAAWDPKDPAEYAIEAAYVRGFERRDAVQAAEWLARVPENADERARWRAAAAGAFARGDLAEAARLASQGFEVAGRRPSCGAIRYESELLWEIERESTAEVPAETAA